MDKLNFKEWSILADLETIAPLGEDFEFSMARGELKTAQAAITRLMGKLKGEGDLEAWVQSKITKAAEYLDTVADHLTHGEDDTKRTKEIDEATKKSETEFHTKLDNLVHKTFGSSPEEKKKEKKKIVEKCWVGYKQLGMKKKGKKLVPNCVKEDFIYENKSGDSSLRDWFTKSRASDGTPGWVQLGGKYAGKPCAKQPGQTTKPKCGSSKMKAALSDEEEEKAFERKNRQDPNPDREGKAKMVATENALMQGMPKPQAAYEKLATDLASDLKRQAAVRDAKNTRIKQQASQSKMTEEKDACYTKVKSRYKVWPSAYASGALVKCRKVGAKNWGNKTQKEGYEFSNWRDEFKPTEYETVDIIETTPLKETEEIRYCPKCKKNEKKRECKYGESYWKMFSLPASLGGGGAYDPNEVHPANEGVSFEIGSGHKKAQKQAKIRNLATGTNNPNEKSAALKKLSGPSLPLADSVIQPGQLTNEDYQRIQSTGNVYTILFSWRGRPMMSLQLFFPNMKRPSKDEVKKEIEKFYPGAVIMQWYPSPTDSSKPIVVIQGK